MSRDIHGKFKGIAYFNVGFTSDRKNKKFFIVKNPLILVFYSLVLILIIRAAIPLYIYTLILKNVGSIE